jgi:hypothetical protein
MIAAFLRLLTVAGLALMPFSMAAASTAPSHHAPAFASAGDCDNQDGQPSQEKRDSLAGCSAGCSMFMAEQVSTKAPIFAATTKASGPLVTIWPSLPPETATPPPTRA